MTDRREIKVCTPAPIGAEWRLTCDSIGKKDRDQELDAGEQTVDTNSEKLLEKLGFTKDLNGSLGIKAGNNTVEIENGKIIKRVGEDGEVLSSSEKVTEEVR